ncbi:hypothetical protein [Streptomyces sp. NPDC046985]|uniref:hypothetical protein n=1 Tax=Streptomyces sp. NPDC046985 TaxID=3155377 RepID=UPI0033D56485
MTTTQTTQADPAGLALRLQGEPKPVPGRPLCDSIATDRDRAQANGDASGVSDCNVRMGRHLTATGRL